MQLGAVCDASSMATAYMTPITSGPGPRVLVDDYGYQASPGMGFYEHRERSAFQYRQHAGYATRHDMDELGGLVHHNHRVIQSQLQAGISTVNEGMTRLSADLAGTLNSVNETMQAMRDMVEQRLQNAEDIVTDRVLGKINPRLKSVREECKSRMEALEEEVRGLKEANVQLKTDLMDMMVKSRSEQEAARKELEDRLLSNREAGPSIARGDGGADKSHTVLLCGIPYAEKEETRKEGLSAVLDKMRSSFSIPEDGVAGTEELRTTYSIKHINDEGVEAEQRCYSVKVTLTESDFKYRLLGNWFAIKGSLQVKVKPDLPEHMRKRRVENEKLWGQLIAREKKKEKETGAMEMFYRMSWNGPDIQYNPVRAATKNAASGGEWINFTAADYERVKRELATVNTNDGPEPMRA